MRSIGFNFTGLLKIQETNLLNKRIIESNFVTVLRRLMISYKNTQKYKIIIIDLIYYTYQLKFLKLLELLGYFSKFRESSG